MPLGTKVRCLNIYKTCASSLLTVESTEDFRETLGRLLLPTLPAFLQAVAQILSLKPPSAAASASEGEFSAAKGYLQNTQINASVQCCARVIVPSVFAAELARSRKHRTKTALKNFHACAITTANTAVRKSTHK